MQIYPVSQSFHGFNRQIGEIAQKPNKLWADDRKLSPDYTKHLEVFFNNVLYTARKGIGRHAIYGYADVAKLFDTKNIMSLNGESAIFELNDGNILKLSVEKYESYLPEFHAPEIARGSVQTPKEYTIYNPLKNEKTDTFYFVVQEKGEHNISEADKTDLINRVKAAGYEVRDVKPNQFAYFNINGKKEARFIDLGCVVPKGHDIW